MQTDFDPKRFRQALGAFATGVTIVTTVDAQGKDVGVTANSFNSVSLEPPMVLWSLARTSTNFDVFMQAEHFAVHVLASDQDALASRFSQRGVDRFAGLTPQRGIGGVALLGGCAARFECRTAFRYEGGDHVIFVGEVRNFEHWDREPLVFRRGRFALAVCKEEQAAARAPTQASPPSGAFQQDFLVYLLGRAYHQLYMRIRPQVEQRRLDDGAYFALSWLGVRDGLTAAEIDAMVSYTGTRISERTRQQLEALGYATSDEHGRMHLTESGRRTVIELLAVAQSASVDGQRTLDESESRVLQQLLTKVIAATDPGLPHPWS